MHDQIINVYPLIHLYEDGDYLTLSQLYDMELDALTNDFRHYTFLESVVRQYEHLADDDLDYLCWLPEEVLTRLGLASQ